MRRISLTFDRPLLLLVIIVAVLFGLFFFFKLQKRVRKTRNKIISISLYSIIVCLIGLILAGFKIKVENELKKNDIVFVIDLSDSNKNNKELIDNYINKELEYLNDENKVGFVVFANDNINVASINKNKARSYEKYLSNNKELDTSATNLANAIEYATSLFSDNVDKRIVLFTDALETDGNVIDYIKSHEDESLTIDAIYFNNSIENDIQINDVYFADEVKVNKEIPLNINLTSNYATSAYLSIYDNDILVSRNLVNLKGKTEELTFNVTLSDYGTHQIHACIESTSDKNLDNNDYYYAYELELNNKLLIIEGTPNQSSSLSSILNSDYQIDVVSASSVDNSLSYLNNYGEIIIMNASMDDLNSGLVSNLQSYVRSGGGLLTTGGTNTYHYGNFEGSLLEDLLPVNSKLKEDEPVAMMLILDNSSSMRETISGSSKTKLELAKESAIAAINALRDYDYVGIITFDATAEIVVPLTRVSLKENIINEIKKISLGYGTAYAQAFQLANQSMVSFDQANNKHIIFTSDGNPTDSGYVERLSYIRAKGITASMIGIGDDLNMTTLENLASTGGGECYKVTNANQLTNIMVLETNNLTGKYLNESNDITPKIVMHNNIVEGVSSLPALKGYNGLSLKENATSILEYNQDCIYATISYGSGKVGSFASDLSSTYSSNYFEDSRGIKFISNVIKDLYASNKNRQEMQLTIENDNYAGSLTVRTSSNAGRNTVKAIVTAPSNDKKEYDLSLVSNNTYRVIDDSFYYEPGLYTIKIEKQTSRGKIEETYYQTFSYSKEYDVFQNKENSYDMLNELCMLTGGKIYNLDESIFNNKDQTIDYFIDPRLGLLLASLVLFVLNIIVRKFKFKWIHEIIKEKKEAKYEK